MYCCRIFVIIFLIIFTAAATCSSLFPLFRKQGLVGQMRMYYWYMETDIEIANVGIAHTRLYTRDLPCEQKRAFFIASSACSAAGAAFGAIATLFTSAHLAVRRRYAIGCTVSLCTFVAFACMAVCVALTSYMYSVPLCNEKSFREDEYNIVEGFGLMAAACGGYLLTMFFSLCT